eukprot:c8248_g1_i1 orf=651-1967(+)
MHSYLSLVVNWLSHIPCLSLSTQLSSLHWSRHCCSNSCVRSDRRICHNPPVQKLSLSFRHNHIPVSAYVGAAWISVAISIGGLLSWLATGKYFEPEQKAGNDSVKSKGWMIRSTCRQFCLGWNYLLSIGHGICKNKLASASMHFIQYHSTLCCSFLCEAQNLHLPPIFAVTSGIVPSKTIPAAMDMLAGSQLEEALSKQQKVEDRFLVQQDCQVFKTPNSEETVMEPKTGFKFPAVLSYDKCQLNGFNSGLQELAGTGVRSVTLVKFKSIKIYAFGFYVRPDYLRAKLGQKYSNVPPAELKHNSNFYDDLLRHELEMTIRLVVHHKGLKMSMVRSAFETSLRNRLRKIKGIDDDDDAGLHLFCSYFKEGLALPQGTIIDFHWQPGGQLLTRIEGRVVGTIISHDFCRAFFDLYIGDPPVSLNAKHAIGEKLGHLLRTN